MSLHASGYYSENDSLYLLVGIGVVEPNRESVTRMIQILYGMCGCILNIGRSHQFLIVVVARLDKV